MTIRLLLFALVSGVLFSAGVEWILQKKPFLTIRSKSARETFTVLVKKSENKI